MTDATGWRERLAAALVEPLDQRAAAPGETRGVAAVGAPVRKAGVLIPIVGCDAPFICFTQRSDALRHHPGQISFPGGSVEALDASIEAAALREANEEIGLAPRHVEILGELPSYHTVTGFVISPFVGWVDARADFAPDGIEVARLFDVPLTYALNHRRFREHTMERDGQHHRVYSIDYQGDHIWGATAGMLYGLLQRLLLVEQRSRELTRSSEHRSDRGGDSGGE